MNKPILNSAFKIFTTENHGVLTTSDLQSISKFIESLNFDLTGPEKLNSKIYFDGNDFKIGNIHCPLFIQEWKFQDEYEANMVYSLWWQFAKGRDREGFLNKDIINEFTFIVKGTFRLIGRLSNFAQ